MTVLAQSTGEATVKSQSNPEEVNKLQAISIHVETLRRPTATMCQDGAPLFQVKVAHQADTIPQASSFLGL